MAMMSFLLPEKTPSFLLGIGAQLWPATVNKALGREGGKAIYVSMLALNQILLDRLWGWAGEEAAPGGEETTTDVTLR